MYGDVLCACMRARTENCSPVTLMQPGQADANLCNCRRAGGSGLDQCISAHGNLCWWRHFWLFLHGLLLYEVHLNPWHSHNIIASSQKILITITVLKFIIFFIRAAKERKSHPSTLIVAMYQSKTWGGHQHLYERMLHARTHRACACAPTHAPTHTRTRTRTHVCTHACTHARSNVHNTRILHCRNPRLASLYLKRVKTVLAHEKEQKERLKQQNVSARRQMCVFLYEKQCLFAFSCTMESAACASVGVGVGVFV